MISWEGPHAEEVLGVDLLLHLPGVACEAPAAAVLRALAQAMAQGDTCLDLVAWEPQAAAREDLRAQLLRAGLVGTEAEGLPVILAGDLLTSRRFWCYEQRIASELCTRAADTGRLAGLRADPALAADLAALFPTNPAAQVAGVDWQRLAALTALVHGLALITGGPGTGKTTVAGAVIALAARHWARRGQVLDVVIAAPTGKAAQRLRESLIETGRGLVARGLLTTDELAHLTARVATLHRLLGDRQLDRASFVVIDEVSMADAATLARVLARIPRQAQVLLLGDPQQLASVDAGHVLAECARFADTRVAPDLAAWYQTLTAEPVEAAAAHRHPLACCQVALRTNWRSAASPAVSALAQAMQEAPETVLAQFARPELAPAAMAQVMRAERAIPLWIERRDCQQPAVVVQALCQLVQEWAAAVVAAPDAQQALTVLAQRRILCARRSGPLGALALNEVIEEALIDAGLIRPWEDGHYPGRPLMITRNDADLQVFNGDIGIVCGPRGQAALHMPDGAGGLRTLPVHRLNAAEPVFAMSIHKSQGSQFEQVEIVLAHEDRGPVAQLLTRELCYTAVTRAAYAARVWANADLLTRALARRHIRTTGLGHFLARANSSEKVPNTLSE